MSVQTLADPQVKTILDRSFVFLELDVDKEKEAAGWFDGCAIPDTRILAQDGTELDHVVGFMDAASFARCLLAVLERKK